MEYYKKIMDHSYISMSDLKTMMECADLVQVMMTYHNLEVQMQNPTRSGMIEALRNSVIYAKEDIRKVYDEAAKQQEGSYHAMVTSTMEFAVMEEEDLLSFLPVYKQGLANHCIAEIGEALFFKCARCAWLCDHAESSKGSLAS